jgi:uncharacterized membrane protein YdjX (TVP38/TMEM64 family)
MREKRIFTAGLPVTYRMFRGVLKATSSSRKKMKKKTASASIWKPILLLAAVVLVVILAKLFHFGDRISALQDWIKSFGAWGPVVYVFIYIVAVVAALPGTAITFLSGALFGSVIGVIASSIGATIGAALSFLIARYFAREAVEKWVSKRKKFKKLDEMTRKNGALIVAFTRLVPLFPFNILNYSFGLTQVGFWTYVFWSWLCMLPGTIVFVVGADAFTRGLSQGKVPWPLVAVVVGLVIFLALVGWKLKKKIKF